jgi:hypothetical protein
MKLKRSISLNCLLKQFTLNRDGTKGWHCDPVVPSLFMILRRKGSPCECSAAQDTMMYVKFRKRTILACCWTFEWLLDQKRSKPCVYLWACTNVKPAQAPKWYHGQDRRNNTLTYTRQRDIWIQKRVATYMKNQKLKIDERNGGELRLSTLPFAHTSSCSKSRKLWVILRIIHPSRVCALYCVAKRNEFGISWLRLCATQLEEKLGEPRKAFEQLKN